MKTTHITTIGCLLVISVCLNAFMLAVSFGKRSSANFESLNEYKGFKCPALAQERFLRWSENGLMRVCFVFHGPVIRAESGKIQESATFEFGVKIKSESH